MTRINPWWLRALPPTPPEARQLQTHLFRDYTTVVDGTRRETQFEINQPVAAVRAFYRAELVKQGWSYQGAPGPECGWHIQPSTRITDVYDRGGRSLAVYMLQPTATGSRQVHVIEYQGRLTYLFPPTPVPNPGPREALIGDWQAIDQTTGSTFVLCVYDQTEVALAVPGMDAISGKYQWIDQDIRLTLDASGPVASTDPTDGNDPRKCGNLPALLVEGCRAKRVDPAAYPGPDGVIRPGPTLRPLPSRAPYPAPLPPITEYLHIEEVLAVSVEQNSLTLTGASGVIQFSRVMQ